MSDFLSNLAARGRSEADVVQPRPVSLFAPSPLLAGWSSVERGDELETTEYRPAPAATKQPASLASQMAAPIMLAASADLVQPAVSSQQPSQAESAPPGPAVVPTTMPAHPQQVMHPPLQPPQPALPERVVIERIVSASLPVLPPPPPAPQAPVLALPAERMVIEQVPAPASPIGAVPKVQPTPSANPSPLIREVMIERVIAETPSMDSLDERPVISAPLTRPAAPTQVLAQPSVVPAQQRQQELPAPPPPAQTIQVTIGRIEIRATQPASQTRSTRTTSPALSLEDYLKSRSGGSR